MADTFFVGTGKAQESTTLVDALARGRNDLEFWWRFFLKRTPHPGQLEFHENANATLNCLATSNRWGKTAVIPALHYHGQMYKVGAEHRYLDDAGRVIPKTFAKLKYRTMHTADLWETAALVWDEALKLHNDSPELQAFVRDTPASKPPHISFAFGGLWKFRTLGNDASGIDGDSYYLITIDEAGWITDLAEKLGNVIRIRVADVRGRIVIVGTFKPGVSRDFYKLCVQAAAQTGKNIAFDHRGDDGNELRIGGLDASIVQLLRLHGISLDEFEQAAAEGD